MEANQTNSKKPLPFNVSKNQLVQMYLSQMSEQKIRELINDIIFDNRIKKPRLANLDRKIIIRGHLVLHEEFLEWIDIFGLPPGYYLPENY